VRNKKIVIQWKKMVPQTSKINSSLELLSSSYDNKLSKFQHIKKKKEQ
jgi:hypothetical protein